jgi:hypothetical protein
MTRRVALELAISGADVLHDTDRADALTAALRDVETCARDRLAVIMPRLAAVLSTMTPAERLALGRRHGFGA